VKHGFCVSFPHLLKKKVSREQMLVWFDRQRCGGLPEGPGALWLLLRRGGIVAQGTERQGHPLLCCPGSGRAPPDWTGVSVLSPGSQTCARGAVAAAGLGPTGGQQRRDITARGQGATQACPTELRLLPDLAGGPQAAHRVQGGHQAPSVPPARQQGSHIPV